MDKRKIGAIVGVVGVTGAIAASQFIDIDRSTADHMTKNLADQYKNIQDQDKQAPESSAEVTYVEEKVFDPVQNVEYLVQKEEPVQVSAEAIQSSKEESDLPSLEPISSKEEISTQASEEKPEELSSENVPVEKEEKLPEEGDAPAKEAENIDVSLVKPAEEEKAEKEATKAEEEARDFRGQVTADALNVRSGAGEDYEVVDVLPKDTLVEGKIKEGWIIIGEGEDLTYINAEYVQEFTPAAFEQMLARQATLRAEEEARKKAEEEEARKKAEEEAAKKAQEEEARKKAEAEKAQAEKAQAEKAKAEEAAKQETGASFSGFISVSTANVRKEASNSGEIIGVASLNEAIEGVEVASGWIKTTYQGQTAYIHKNVLSTRKTKIEEKQEETKPAQSEKTEKRDSGSGQVSGYISADSLFVRQGPGMGYQQIGHLSRNEAVQGTDLNNGWTQINYKGAVGYISSKFISQKKLAEPRPEDNEEERANPSGQVGQGSIDRIIAMATSKVGKPYIYGATGPNAFDCSGFTSWLYKSLGYSLNRRAIDQASNGYAVSRQNLQPGDLVFFSNDSSGGVIAHVGLYIGNGQLIHASTPSTGVRYDNMNSSWFVNHYKGARRIIN